MPVPTSLSSTDDAIRIAEVALGADHLAAIVDGRTKVIVPVSGPTSLDALDQLDDLLLGMLGDEPGRLVLATRRRSGPAFVLEDELDRWRRLCARHHDRPLRLCDWLVFVRGDVVLSLAELAGPEAVWS